MTSTLGGEFASHTSTSGHFPKKLPTGITFSFSAGGWLQMYMFGVAHALQQSGVVDHYNLKILGENSFTAQSSNASSSNDPNSFIPASPVEELKTPTVLLPTSSSTSPQKSSNNNINNSSEKNFINNDDDDDSNGPRPVRFVGASAGALAACCLAADLDMNDVRDFTLDCGEHMNSKWYHFFFMKHYVEIAIDKFATEIMARDDEAGTHEMQDRFRKTLGIYCTVLPLFNKKKFNEFSCVDDVKEALFASLCAAPMVGFPFRLRSTGELVVDGGIAAFQPKSGKSNVVTVSPFYFANADIRPSQFLPMLWAFRPPGKKAHAALFDLGYNDAIDYLVRKQYIAPQSSAFIRKPDPKTPRRGVFAIFRDLVFLLFSYILVRPIAIVVVYMEMIVMASYYFGRALISNVFGKGGATIVDWVETMANLCSPAVFMHMAVSPRIPVNERRLAKRSITFRVFAPIFGQPKIDEDENDLLGKKSQQKKRFAVHVPVGAPTQTQVLFDKFKNLGWSGGNSMFKEEQGKVVVPGNSNNNNNNNNNNTLSPITSNLINVNVPEQMVSGVLPSPTKNNDASMNASDLIILSDDEANDDKKLFEEETETKGDSAHVVTEKPSSIEEVSSNKNDNDDHENKNNVEDNFGNASNNTFTVEKTAATHESRKTNLMSSSSSSSASATTSNVNNNRKKNNNNNKAKKGF